MNSKNGVASLIATGMLLGALTGKPYSDLGFKIPAGKSQRGRLVGCHVCGASHVTLYKDGEKRICGKCRKERDGMRGEYDEQR